MKNIVKMKKLSGVYLSCMLLLASIVLVSCKEEEVGNIDNIPGLGGDEWAKTPVDDWIFTNITTPYNISIKYKWDQFEFDNIIKTLVPADEAQVIPLLTSIDKGWAKPYVEEAGKVFFNKYSPKLFVLSGSVEYNLDGSVTGGQAEGGRKIVMMGINRFKIKGMPGYSAATDSAYAKFFIFHVIQHEFGHILHQNKNYPQEYKTISAGKYYGANWINFNDRYAQRDGFISAYSASNFDDDFVEMIAVMLMEGKDGFDKIVNAIPEGATAKGTTREQAQAALRQKEAMIVNYYKNSWNIDFYALQKKTRAAMVSMF
jgi:substrate import-associated zinc metallohydrolase lipoprotein